MKYLFTSSNCPHCKKAKEKLSDELKSGDIKEMPVEEKEGRELADKLNILAIPTLVECEEDKCKVLF